MSQGLKSWLDSGCRACGADAAAAEARYTRLSGKQEFSPSDGDWRTPGERDRDRVLYSLSFRRLAEITQVIPRERGFILHNRMTHTLKVAQLGRRIAERLLRAPDGTPDPAKIELANALGGLDPDVVETACLAHDLGHPPYGHVIEEFLDRKLKPETSDGFEGNAQTFRIITYLENRDLEAQQRFGLDLTRASINATLKYPWQRATEEGARGKKTRKFGFYSFAHTDAEHFATVRNALADHCGGDLRSLEAEVMDWADDIAYAIYDLDDFYRAGLIPLDAILKEIWLGGADAHRQPENELAEIFGSTRKRWRTQERSDSEIAKLDDVFECFGSLMQRFILAPQSLSAQREIFEADRTVKRSFKGNMPALMKPYRARDGQRRALNSFTSNLVGELVSAIEMAPGAVHDQKKPKISILGDSLDVVKFLKELTWHYVIDSAELHAIQQGHREIVEKIFDSLNDAPEHDVKLIPASIREIFGADLLSGALRRRLVCDIISNMSEAQIEDLYARLTGTSLGSLLRTGGIN